MKLEILILGGVLLFIAPSVSQAIVINQIDTFADGSTMDWTEGTNDINQPTNISDGGPLGPGDNYLLKNQLEAWVFDLIF